MAEEFLDVIDEADQVTGKETRLRVHQLGLWHRGVHVFLFNKDGRLLIQKRSADRASSPSLLDCSVSEHVQSGESFEDAAIRGLKEEMGVAGIEIEPLVKFKMNYGPNDNEISILYKGIIDEMQVRFDPEEISEIEYMTVDEIRDQMDQSPEKFCGWFIQIFNWYLGKNADLTVL